MFWKRVVLCALCLRFVSVYGADEENDGRLFFTAIGTAFVTMSCFCLGRCVERGVMWWRGNKRVSDGRVVHWYAGPERPISVRILRKDNGLPDFPLHSLVGCTREREAMAYKRCDDLFRVLLKKVQRFSVPLPIEKDGLEIAPGCCERTQRAWASLRGRRRNEEQTAVFDTAEQGMLHSTEKGRGREDLVGRDEIDFLLWDKDSEVAGTQLSLSIYNDSIVGVLTGVGKAREQDSTYYFDFYRKFLIDRVQSPEKKNKPPVEELVHFFETNQMFHGSVFQAGELVIKHDFTGVEAESPCCKRVLTLYQSAKGVKESYYIEEMAKKETIIRGFFERKERFLLQYIREDKKAVLSVADFCDGWGWRAIAPVVVGTTVVAYKMRRRGKLRMPERMPEFV